MDMEHPKKIETRQWFETDPERPFEVMVRYGYEESIYQLALQVGGWDYQDFVNEEVDEILSEMVMEIIFARLVQSLGRSAYLIPSAIEDEIKRDTGVTDFLTLGSVIAYRDILDMDRDTIIKIYKNPTGDNFSPNEAHKKVNLGRDLTDFEKDQVGKGYRNGLEIMFNGTMEFHTK